MDSSRIRVTLRGKYIIVKSRSHNFKYTSSYFRYVPSQADVAIFEALSGAPAESFVHARRWYKHIDSYSADERLR